MKRPIHRTGVHTAAGRPAVGLLPTCVVLYWLLAFCLARPLWAESEEMPLDEGSVGEHLRQAQTLLENGQEASALLEFEQVVDFDSVSPYLSDKSEVYSAAAEDFEQGKRLSAFAYLEGGGGHYREENSSTTDNLGVDPVRTDYWRARLGGGLGYVLNESLVFNGTLDYRYVEYSESDIRDDRDLRWRGTLTRSLQAGSRSFGIRGRASYRGNDGYRHDYGVYANRSFALNELNQLVIEAELRTRKYPQGRERNRSRDIGEVWVRWTRSLLAGSAALRVAINGGREWETNDRPSGDQTFYGVRLTWTQTISSALDFFVFGLWEHNGFHEDIPFDDGTGVLRPLPPDLDVYELGGGASYEIAPGWTLRPEVIYLRDEGDTPTSDYESIEYWLTVRKTF